MALSYYPKLGEIVLCDYSTGFQIPEMVKRRPVVVISPRLRNRHNLVTVVPLSTTAPEPVAGYHCRVSLTVELPKPFDAAAMWAKCDMVSAVSRNRLDRFRAGRSSKDHGRKYVTGQLDSDQLKAVRCAVLFGLGFDSLTVHM
jgi:mRNA interferase MazF